MHFSSLIISTILALSATAAAAPTTTSTDFTFAQWIEDIIANPQGDHLSPEEAVAAKNAAVASASATNPLLQERAYCDQKWGRANANDAASCLSYLAKLGAQGVWCGIADGQSDVQMCRIGNAQVVSSKGEKSAQGANW